VAVDDDFDPKKRVQELVWAWSQRLLVLAITFGAGYFASYLQYGQGPDGAISLRSQIVGCRSDVDRITKEREDLRSKFEVVNPRLEECQRNIAKIREEAAAAKQAAGGAAPQPQ